MHVLRPRVLTAACMLLAAPLDHARAEFNFDFSIGSAFTHDTTVRAEDEVNGTRVNDETSIDPSFALGGRLAYWIDPFPWIGLGMDFSYFRAEGGPIVQNDVYPFSFLVMGRATLFPSRRFPYGELQPYAAVGPSAVFTDAVIDLRPDVTDRVTDSTTDLGLDARAGLAWEFVPHFALFFEYRFLYFRQRLDNGDDFFFDDTTATSRTTFATHFAMVGISFRF